MGNDTDSGMSAIVGIVAVIAIIAIAYFAIRLFQGQMDTTQEQPVIDVNLPGGNQPQ